MNVLRRIDGLCLWSDGNLLLRSVGRRIDISLDNGLSFTAVGRLSLGWLRNLASLHRLTRRLLRSNVRHCVALGHQRFLLVAGSGVHRLDLAEPSLRRVADIHGSRPLAVAVDGDTVLYGEYRDNAERSAVAVWRSADQGSTWESAHVFEGIRHVHAVAVDPYARAGEAAIWITTGDNDDECAIWRTDRAFGSLEPVLGGSQQSRVIHVLFTPDSILFGTDAPDEPNAVYRLDRTGGEPRKLGQVAGPVFHARTVGDKHWFSTACEPSEVNSCERMDVHCLAHGELTRVASFQKDRWHMRYFQYGQVSFADGPGPGEGVWLSPLAGNADQSSLWLSPTTTLTES